MFEQADPSTRAEAVPAGMPPADWAARARNGFAGPFVPGSGPAGRRAGRHSGADERNGVPA